MSDATETKSIQNNVWFAGLLLLIGFCIFARPLFLSWFDAIPGELGDSRFNLFVLEHWFQSLRGQNTLLSPPMFYPVRGTLGYSDAMFLFALPYSVFRFFGISEFGAYSLTLHLVLVLGLVGMSYFLQKRWKLPWVAAVCGSMLALIPNVAYLSVGHPQLYAVNFIPFLLLSGSAYLARLDTTRWSWNRIKYGLLTLVLLASLFLTSFYIAWFFLFFLLLFGCTYFIFLLITRETSTLLQLGRSLRTHGIEWLVLAVCFVLACLPFLGIYLPVSKQMGPRPYWHIQLMLPEMLDFINVGFHNMIWGDVVQHAFPSYMLKRPFQPERLKGIPPVTLILFLGSGLLLTVQHFRRKSAKHLLQHSFAVVLFGTVLVSWLLLWKMTPKFSLWKLVFSVVPGCSAIRAVFRFQHILVIAMAIVLVTAWFQLLQHSTKKWVTYTLCAAMLWMGVEQLNTANFYQYFRTQQLKRLAAIQSPQKTGCDSFFIELDPKQPFYALNIDAMFVANRFGIPTWNGYSGNTPKGYPIVHPKDYYRRTLYWVSKHSKAYKKTCILNFTQGTWKVCEMCEELRKRRRR